MVKSVPYSGVIAVIFVLLGAPHFESSPCFVLCSFLPPTDEREMRVSRSSSSVPGILIPVR